MNHKTAITSINCYKNHIKGWRENSENAIIYDTIKRIQPCSGRMIQKETGMEINNIARSLNNLWFKLRPAPIQKSHRGHCPVTGVEVQFYHISKAQLSLQL